MRTRSTWRRRFLIGLVVVLAGTGIGTAGNLQAADEGFKKGLQKSFEIADSGGLEQGSFFNKDGVMLPSGPLAIVFAFLAALVLFVLIIGGVMYILSFGNEERAKLAKRIIIYAIVGLIIIGVSGILVNLFLGLFPLPEAKKK